MKVTYKGYQIEAKREKCLGGWTLLYYSVFRVSDLYECLSDFSYGEDTVRDWIKMLKERVDAELLEGDPWGEKASRYPLGYMQGRGAA